MLTTRTTKEVNGRAMKEIGTCLECGKSLYTDGFVVGEAWFRFNITEGKGEGGVCNACHFKEVTVRIEKEGVYDKGIEGVF